LSIIIVRVKKLLIIVLILILITGIFLNRSYAYFYNFFNQNRLTASPHEKIVITGNNSEGRIIKYAAMGDSLTAGVGTADYRDSYPFLLANKLASENQVELINQARAGDNSSEVLAVQLPQVLSLNPDVVTLLIGTNDIHNLKSLEEFNRNYTQIVSQLKKTGAKIYLLSIPYLGSSKIVSFPYNFLLDLRTKQFNGVIKKAAADYGVFFVNLYAINQPAGFYSADQFHPSAEGYKTWAKEINVN